MSDDYERGYRAGLTTAVAECMLIDAEAEPFAKGGLAVTCAESILKLVSQPVPTETAKRRAIEGERRLIGGFSISAAHRIGDPNCDCSMCQP